MAARRATAGGSGSAARRTDRVTGAVIPLRGRISDGPCSALRGLATTFVARLI